MYSQFTAPRFRRVNTIITLALVLSILGLIQLVPLDESTRLLASVLVLMFGISGRLISRRISIGDLNPFLIHGLILYHSIAIAVVDYLVQPIDLSPLYFLRILSSALMWNRSTALSSAFFASFFRLGVVYSHGLVSTGTIAEAITHAALYFAAAILVSELASTLSTRWRLSAAIADQQHQELARRKDELELLHDIAQTMGNLRDVPKVYHHLTRRIAEVLKAEICTIMRLDSTRQKVLGIPPGFGLSDEQISKFSYPVTESVLAIWNMTKTPFYSLRDLSGLPSEMREIAKAYGILNVAAARMMIQGAPAGYVLVCNRKGGVAFTDSDLHLLGILAEQTAVVVENIWLYSEQQTNLENAARLYSISTELLSRLNPEEIPKRVVSAVAEAFYAPIATIALVNEESGWLEYAAHIGLPEESIDIPFREDGLGMTVVRSGNPIYIENIAQDTRPNPASIKWGYQAVACVPIRRGEKAFGALYVNFAEPRAFTTTERNFLAIFANQTAIALENARLYAREQLRARQLAAISNIGHRASAILELDELLPTLVQLIHTTFGYSYAHLFLNDPDQRVTVLRAGAGSTLEPVVPLEFRLDYGSGLVGWVAEYGETVLANDVSKEHRFLYHPSVADTCAELTIPLKARGEVIGVLDVQSTKLNAFDPSDVTTLETLAGQVAIAIDNARLYGQVQEQARRDSLTQVYNHGYFIQQLHLHAERAQAAGQPLALIMLDIDHYKAYNDRYGHVIGDRVLTEIVQAIRANVKATDIVGRWGGEEFGIILPSADLDGAWLVAERIRETIRQKELRDKQRASIPPPTVSQGIAVIPTHASDAGALIDLADAALYRAKARGRDQVEATQSKIRGLKRSD